MIFPVKFDKILFLTGFQVEGQQYTNDFEHNIFTSCCGVVSSLKLYKGIAEQISGEQKENVKKSGNFNI